MPELRQNFATKEWVIIATERARRPHDFADSQRELTQHQPEYDPTCPFCPGHEHLTRPTLMQWPARGPWLVRVFSNFYPALSREGERELVTRNLERKMNGVGYHEVIVESPLHNATPALQRAEELTLTLKAFQTRGREMSEDPRMEHVVYFKNHGPSAGCSVAHAHAQIVGLPVVPLDTRERIAELRRNFDDDGLCPYCQMARLELEQGERMITENEYFVAFIPYAAFSPFHTWIVPRRHGPTFLDQSPEELRSLAQIMREVLGKIYYGLNDPDYNYIIRSAPNRDATSAYIHWYVSIVPRVTKMAGFELSSGMYINPSLPEQSARFLREQNPDGFEGTGEPPAPAPSEAAGQSRPCPGVEELS